MTQRLRRAGAFAVVGTLALAAPALGPATAVPFAAIAVLAAFVVDEGPLFELFARPVDREERRLYGLAGFSLAAAGLALLATAPRMSMPTHAFVAAVFVLAYGNLGAQFVRTSTTDEFLVVAGFAVTGFVAGFLGGVAVRLAAGGPVDLAALAFLAAVGVLAAALLRTVLYERDDALTMLPTGFALWLFASVELSVGPAVVVTALAVTASLGYVSYALEAASVPGMLTGVLLCLLTIVLGGPGWFALLLTFFGVGALSTKFRYEEKRERGVAEENEGARGSGNVLGNAAVALAAVVAFAASEHLPVAGVAFLFAFAGSLAAALADTLSSEIGGLYDRPRLVTTMEPVEPGTDGAVTWQGEVAGLAGTGLVAVIAVGLLDVGPVGAAVVVAGGFVGMTVDSLLGATVEGDRLENEAVNFLATLAGAVVSVLLWLVLVA